jgi:hypothetical protein
LQGPLPRGAFATDMTFPKSWPLIAPFVCNDLKKARSLVAAPEDRPVARSRDMKDSKTKTRPMTPMQEELLRDLCRKTGERVEKDLTEAQASCRIEVLKSLDTLPCK